ncbi:hypothetical protein BGZ81_010139 [Podila clonocystis]|nr:hypothetical protein BGZ81_010139 [Podila clonocystis]
MRFLALLVAAQTIATLALATPVPEDVPGPNNCNSCLLTNIRKVQACSWWNQNIPWLAPGDWTQAQRACVCSLSQNYNWIDSCQKPDWCSPDYGSKLKDMYTQWRPNVCQGNGGYN